MYDYTNQTSGCYKCKERHIGCHSNCKIYEEYLHKKDVINNKKKEIKILDAGRYIKRGRK